MNSSASCCRKPENLLCFIPSNVYNHHTPDVVRSVESQWCPLVNSVSVKAATLREFGEISGHQLGFLSVL